MEVVYGTIGIVRAIEHGLFSSLSSFSSSRPDKRFGGKRARGVTWDQARSVSSRCSLRRLDSKPPRLGSTRLDSVHFSQLADRALPRAHDAPFITECSRSSDLARPEPGSQAGFPHSSACFDSAWTATAVTGNNSLLLRLLPLVLRLLARTLPSRYSTTVYYYYYYYYYDRCTPAIIESQYCRGSR